MRPLLSTTAHPVSSHDVSMPKITAGLLKTTKTKAFFQIFHQISESNLLVLFTARTKSPMKIPYLLDFPTNYQFIHEFRQHFQN